jgi:hypothetical protein
VAAIGANATNICKGDAGGTTAAHLPLPVASENSVHLRIIYAHVCTRHRCTQAGDAAHGSAPGRVWPEDRTMDNPKQERRNEARRPRRALKRARITFKGRRATIDCTVLNLTGHTVLTGFQKAWPPRFPEVNAGVTFCGFFGIFSAACNLTSANEDSISVLIERERLVQVHGDGVLFEDYDFGGISGGPLIAIVQTPTIRSWIPAGVIIQGPNPTGDISQSIQGFEMIKARPVQYILPDGRLDVHRWEMNNIHRNRG